MARQARTLLELAQIRADNRSLLNSVVGTQGTALGRKNFTPGGAPDGEPCVIVYVPHKINEALLDENLMIPKVLRSVDEELEAKTDVVVTTVPSIPKADPVLTPTNQALVNTLQWLDGQLDHIPAGAQIGAGAIEDGSIAGFVGTIGYAVRMRGGAGLTGILTNQHVGVKSGQSIYIPGFGNNSIRLGVTREVLEHRADDEWLPGVNETFAYVRTDSAFVVVESDTLRPLLGNRVPVGEGQSIDMGEVLGVDLQSLDVIGLRVKKVGRTTGVQRGTVVAFGYGIASDQEVIDRAVGQEPANYYTDLLIAPDGDQFSAPGDSGSPILTDTPDRPDLDNRPVGLLWGGRPTDIGRSRGLEDLTYGISLDRILQSMDLELL